jgi:KUP system potassium uptake protein
LLALGGGALFYGDSMITPAISVLSAVEGLGIATALRDARGTLLFATGTSLRRRL